MPFYDAQFEKTDYGHIQIAPEVIQVIAGLSTLNVDGVAAMSGGFAGGIAELLGKKNLSKGIKVDISDSETVIDISIIAKYGHKVMDVCTEIQEKVKQSVYTMTEINVSKVNVHVSDIQMPQEEPKELEVERIR